MVSNIDAKPRLQSGYVWRGLGAWNFYFIAKLALYLTSFIDFNIFYNLVFAAFLLIPVPSNIVHILRNILALPAAIALLYYDSWLPPFSRLLGRSEVLQFSNEYVIELLLRFINWNLLGAGLIFFTAYLFFSQWLRMTAWTVLALVLLALPHLPRMPSLSWAEPTETTVQLLNVSAEKPLAIAQDSGGINTLLNQELELFYQAEQNRITKFSLPAADATSFDVLLLNICSLAWADLEVSQLTQHPLFSKLDIVFDNFNSATSYSGPALSRLMRASCGQPTHEGLYQDASQQCYLFDNLKNLGFTGSAALNHDGQYENYLDKLKSAGFLSAPMIPSESKPKLQGFFNTPVWGDYDTLKLWWVDRLTKDEPSAVLLYNSISLHDGNREATADGGSRPAPYAKRAKALLDDLETFMAELEASGRQVMVVLVPEHGAAVKGDRMQISGMREIPTPEITHVPVGVRFIGAESATSEDPLYVSVPTSYLALSELISRVVSQGVFDQPKVDWRALVSDLPETQAISENEGTVMMDYQGVPYLRLGKRDWVKYVQ